MIRLATLFSGIGAIEQAFIQKGLEKEIIFACDNGDIKIDVDYEKELKKIRKMYVLMLTRLWLCRMVKMWKREALLVIKPYIKQNYL